MILCTPTYLRPPGLEWYNVTCRRNVRAHRGEMERVKDSKAS